MRFLKMLCLLSVVLLGGAVSCSSLQPARPDDPAVRKARADWRVVARRLPGLDACPDVAGWSGLNWLGRAVSDPLRQPAESYEAEEAARKAVSADPALKAFRLDEYCVYESLGNAAFPFERLPEGLVEAAYSQMTLAPSGDPGTPEDKAQAELARHFFEQAAGNSVATGARWTPNPQTSDPVRLVFLDTQPDGEGVPSSAGRSRHGYTLVHLADQLLCRGLDRCPIQLATRLALPRMDTRRPDRSDASADAGGRLGAVDDLAQAITREVLFSHLKHPDQHLVLNLSVGWDGELLRGTGRTGSALEPDAQLVQRALRYARQSGALVIAAAGNRRGGEESNGPLLPAAWEIAPVAEPTRGAAGPPAPPLVYAVGGVDWQDLPLPNFRRKGLPTLVAFGDHATVTTQAPDEPAMIYTGTSVSTAVVSATAAAVWQLRPELAPARVMSLLLQSGKTLPGRADFYARRLRRAPHLRRVSLCAAVQQACEDGSRCRVPACNLPRRAADMSARALLHGPNPKVTALPPTDLPADCVNASTPSPSLFAPASGRGALTDGAHACPLHLLQDKNGRPWVGPQPDDPPCPGCTFEPPPRTAATAYSAGTYMLTLEISPDWQATGVEIQSAALDVDRYIGGRFVRRATYVIPQNVLSGALTGPQSFLADVGNGGSLAGCTASLNFKVTVGGTTFSVQNPVYVDP
jgi:hypothetical protein